MEGSSHIFPTIYELLAKISALAKYPARSIVIDSVDEDNFVAEHAANDPLYDDAAGNFGMRDEGKFDGGGLFVQAESVYDTAAAEQPLDTYIEATPTYDIGGANAYDDDGLDQYGDPSDPTSQTNDYGDYGDGGGDPISVDFDGQYGDL